MFSARGRAEAAGRSCGDATAALQAADQLLLGERALLEELLHQLVVGLGHHLDERLARRLDRRLHVRRERVFLELAAAVGLVHVGLHRDQVDDAAERLLLADRQLDRDDRRGRTPPAASRACASRLARSRSSRLRTTSARQLELLGRFPHLLGLHLDAGRRRRRRRGPHRPRACAASASLRKLPNPGVSMRLILCLFHSA